MLNSSIIKGFFVSIVSDESKPRYSVDVLQIYGWHSMMTLCDQVYDKELFIDQLYPAANATAADTTTTAPAAVAQEVVASLRLTSAYVFCERLGAVIKYSTLQHYMKLQQQQCQICSFKAANMKICSFLCVEVCASPEMYKMNFNTENPRGLTLATTSCTTKMQTFFPTALQSLSTTAAISDPNKL